MPNHPPAVCQMTITRQISYINIPFQHIFVLHILIMALPVDKILKNDNLSRDEIISLPESTGEKMAALLKRRRGKGKI